MSIYELTKGENTIMASISKGFNHKSIRHKKHELMIKKMNRIANFNGTNNKKLKSKKA